MASRGLAHDLKNLIMPIWTWMLHEVDRYTPGSTEADVYNRACGALRVMKNYIDEAIFFTERLHPHFESVDLIPVAQEVCEITGLRAANRGITLRVESDNPEIIVADRILLQRAVLNLVNNAIDASQIGAEVVISIVSDSSNRVRIAIRDTGMGVSLENASRIFEPYFTTKNSGDRIRGFGLGLTIVQKIVLLHQGNISVRSILNIGTTIVIELPRKPLLG
jgi:signal transduction histidine kinase